MFFVGIVVPSVIPAIGTRLALTKGEVVVGDCSGGKILSPPPCPKMTGGSCLGKSLGDSYFIIYKGCQDGSVVKC